MPSKEQDERTYRSGRTSGASSRGRRGGRAAARPVRRAGGVRRVGAYRRAAQRRLKSFRQGSVLAVGITGLALLLIGEPGASQDSVAADPARSVEEATGTVRELVLGAWGILPKVAIALGVLLLAGVLSWLVRRLLRATFGRFEQADAAAALTAVIIWVLAIAAALSIVAGDARALIGSVGLVGLALSWALQGPIESFTAWLLNSFKGYYRPGDRIAVGEVFGDVYRIDILTTTVWESGGAGKAVQAAQPTGALITFPNSELLRANVINYTRDFPYVWDEVVAGVANESDLVYTRRVVTEIARQVVGPVMHEPARQYRELLERSGLHMDVAEEPEVYMAPTDAWMNVVVRYLVPARERRRWSSTLHQALARGMGAPEHRGRILAAYPRTVVQHVDPAGPDGAIAAGS
ncbi:MAG: mechanosensitive ion channel domain-containing protein [Gemmatimonadota bacterium]